MPEPFDTYDEAWFAGRPKPKPGANSKAQQPGLTQAQLNALFEQIRQENNAPPGGYLSHGGYPPGWVDNYYRNVPPSQRPDLGDPRAMSQWDAMLAGDPNALLGRQASNALLAGPWRQHQVPPSAMTYYNNTPAEDLLAMQRRPLTPLEQLILDNSRQRQLNPQMPTYAPNRASYPAIGSDPRFANLRRSTNVQDDRVFVGPNPGSPADLFGQ